MKTVLFLFHVSSIGGGSYCLLNILKEIDRTSLRPIVLLKNEGPLADEIRKLDIPVFFLSSLTQVPYNRSLFNISSIKAYACIKSSLENFSAWLKDKTIDIVYINTMMLYPYLKVAKQLGKKTVIHIRECWPENEHRNQLRWAQNAIEKFADHIVAINQRSASIVSSLKYKTTIVYDWIDFSERYEYMPFDEIFGEDCSKLKVYLFTGGVVTIKGGLVVANTFINKVKDKNARLLMLGVDTDIVYKGLRGLIRRFLSMFGIYSRSDQLRRLVQTDERIRCIPATYKIKHLIEQSYCMLSYFLIPHANLALAECLILKTPVVAADTSEAVEYAGNTRLNAFFKLNDASDFAEKVFYLEQNYEKEKNIVEVLSEKVEEKFGRESNSSKINSLLSKL